MQMFFGMAIYITLPRMAGGDTMPKIIRFSNNKTYIMEFTIETGVAVPTNVSSKKTSFTPIYEKMAEMESGQCLTFTAEIKPGLKNPIGNAVYNCRKFARTLVGRSFVVKDMGANVCKVWEITE